MSKFIHAPEQAAEWATYRDRWIDIAFRTDPMTDEEKELFKDVRITIDTLNTQDTIPNK